MWFTHKQPQPSSAAFSGQERADIWIKPSLVPRLSWNPNMYHRESLVSFLRKHDVIKIGLKQKGNILHVVQPTTCFNVRCV